MTQEAALLITRALTEPQSFSWEGKYYRYQNISIWPGLIQRPHLPLFSSGNSFESATFAAGQGHGLAVSFAPPSYIAQVIPHYKAEAARHGWEPREEHVVFRGNVIIADTDEEAQQLADHLATLPHLKRTRGVPASAATSAPKEGEQQSVPAATPNLIGYAQFCGSPQTVVSQMKELHDLGVGAVDLVIPTGLISQDQVLHSLELLGKEVLPRIHDFSPAA